MSINTKLVLLFLCSILLIGCCSNLETIKIVEKQIPYEICDTIPLIGDTIWYGGLTRDNDTIGSLAVNPESKTAIVNIKEKIKYKDSLIYVPKEVEKEKVIQTISGPLDWWGEGLLILFAVVLLVIQNKSKALNILSWLKTILKIK